MKKNIVIKFSILLCVAMTLFGMVSCGLLVYNDNKLIGDNLISLANGYAGALIVSDPESVVKYDTNYKVRVTIVDATGRVLADSYGKEDSMDNHLEREEIKNANTADNSKIVRRHSQTANTTLLYYAKKVDIGDSYNYVRVSMETADVSVYLTTTIVSILIITVIMIILSSIMANAVTKGSLKPLESLESNLEGIKQGSYHPIIPNDKDAEMNAIISKINDISEVIASGISETNNERDKLNNLLENMSQAVVACDKESKIIFCNSRAKSLFETEDMIGKSAISIMREPIMMDAMSKVKVDGQTTVYFDKNLKNYRSNITKITAAEGEIALIILVSDITNLKIAERERREFFANASHELKTPLTTIKGYAELIGEGIAKGEKAKIYGDNISKETNKLIELINDMLTLSRLDENIDIGTKIVLNLSDEVKNTVLRFNSSITKRNITLNIHGDGKVLISQENLNCILSNLISNAIRYNVDNGSIDIDISSYAQATVLKIKDTGIGISKNDLPRITERFYKSDMSRTVTSSTGLGLAIVKHLAELNKIELAITSELGKGTEVSLTFKAMPKNYLNK